MFGKAVDDRLIWDLSVSGVVDDSQRWVLPAMQRHGQDMVTLLWRILGNEQDVCDAYQAVFLQLACHQMGRKPEHVKAYLFRTATNVAMSMFRQRAAEKRILSKADPARDDVPSPCDELDARLLQHNLRACLTHLPEHLRNVIVMRDLAELPYPQVAKILGISSATARVYRCKAVRLLAVWMGGKTKP